MTGSVPPVYYGLIGRAFYANPINAMAQTEAEALGFTYTTTETPTVIS